MIGCTKKEMEGHIVQALGELDVIHPNGYGYEEQAEHILKRILERGMKPPFSNEGLSNYDIAMGSNPYKWRKDESTK